MYQLGVHGEALRTRRALRRDTATTVVSDARDWQPGDFCGLRALCRRIFWVGDWWETTTDFAPFRDSAISRARPSLFLAMSIAPEIGSHPNHAALA